MNRAVIMKIYHCLRRQRVGPREKKRDQLGGPKSCRKGLRWQTSRVVISREYIIWLKGGINGIS